jgi:hypothetical protein
LWLDRGNICTNDLDFVSNPFHYLNRRGTSSTTAEWYRSATSIASNPWGRVSI